MSQETYLIGTCSLKLLHLRERMTVADRMLKEEVGRMLLALLKIEHLIFSEKRVGHFPSARPDLLFWEPRLCAFSNSEAHRWPTSFIAALRDKACEILQANGHEVDNLDLYAEEFDPVLSPQMRRDYLNVDRNTREVETYVRRLRAADALALFFPVWF